MAYVDLVTGEIEGVEQGTKTYYHEVGHLNFTRENKLGVVIRELQTLSFQAIVFLSAMFCLLHLDILKIAIIISLFTKIGTEIYEEYWAWLYAHKEYGNKIRGKTEAQI